jgi:hypothetical protein
MDTTWCAIDRNGFMGVFFSGEGGFMPEQAEVLDDFFAIVRELRGEPADEDDEWGEMEQVAANAGLSLYQYIEEFDLLAVHYQTMYGAGSLRHVSQAPPRIRRLFKKLRLAGVDFTTDEIVQPIEHVPAADIYFYYPETAAYLASDRKTVRPIPGKEDSFAQFVQEYRSQSAGDAKGRTFEGVPDEAPAAPAKRRRKKDEK